MKDRRGEGVTREPGEGEKRVMLFEGFYQGVSGR